MAAAANSVGQNQTQAASDAGVVDAGAANTNLGVVNPVVDSADTEQVVPVVAVVTPTADPVVEQTVNPLVNSDQAAVDAVDALLNNPSGQVILDGIDDQPITTNSGADTLGDPATAAATVTAMHAELATAMQALQGEASGVQDTTSAQEDAEHSMSDHEIDQLLKDALPGITDGASVAALACNPACGTHGACVQGRCVCAALVNGPSCSMSVILSWPTLPDPQSEPLTAYRGGFVLSKVHNLQAPLTVCQRGECATTACVCCVLFFFCPTV